jgi:hypothetical protein
MLFPPAELYLPELDKLLPTLGDPAQISIYHLTSLRQNDSLFTFLEPPICYPPPSAIALAFYIQFLLAYQSFHLGEFLKTKAYSILHLQNLGQCIVPRRYLSMI